MGILGSIIDKSISGSFSNTVSRLRSYAFKGCSNLTDVSFPNVTVIPSNASTTCSKLIIYISLLCINKFCFVNTYISII